MYHKNQFNSLKLHLKERYLNLIEKSNSYRFVDESESDLAAFKAMKLKIKINRFHYLDREMTN